MRIAFNPDNHSTGKNMSAKIQIKNIIINKAKYAVLNNNDTEAAEVAREALDNGLDPLEIIEEGFIEGMKYMGDKFQEGELSILHVLAASKTMNTGIEILKTRIIATNQNTGFFGNLMVN